MEAREAEAPAPPAWLILASASPRRRELLRLLGLPFVARAPSGVDEEAERGPAAAVARRLAAAKATAVLDELTARPPAGVEPAALVVLGADTLVALGEGAQEEAFGKPRDAAHAREMLERLSGRVHRVVTGVAVARPGAPVRVEVEASAVEFRSLARAEVDAYVATGEPHGKAGAYAIQGAGAALIAGFRGCYYNIVGLPLRLTATLLRHAAPASTCDCGAHPLQRGTPGCGARPVLTPGVYL